LTRQVEETGLARRNQPTSNIKNYKTMKGGETDGRAEHQGYTLGCAERQVLWVWDVAGKERNKTKYK
jgi:hypothetical protein